MHSNQTITVKHLFQHLSQTVAESLGLGAGSSRHRPRRRRKPGLTLEYLEGRALPSATTGAEIESESDDHASAVAQTSEHDTPEDTTPPICQSGAPEQQEGQSEPRLPCDLRNGPPPGDRPLPPPPPHKPPLPPPDLLHQFLHKLYAQLLRREADQGGLECWKEKLEHGLPREAVAQAISDSQEGREVKIKDLYRKHLGREADDGGVQGFTQALNQGATLDQVKATLVGSDEYFKHRGGGNHAGFVKALYRDALNREVDPAGAAAWAERLGRGESLGAVATQVLGSDECKKQHVQGLYQQILNRPADDNGLHAFVNALQQGTREERLECQFLGSQEFYDHEE